MLLSLSSKTNSFLQFLTVLILFVVVLVITYMTTRWISNYQKGKNQGANIEVIETTRIAPNKVVQIIRIGEKYIAVASGKDEVTMLTEIPKEELNLFDGGSGSTDFSQVFERVKKLTEKEKE